MANELIYTSAEHGLKPRSKGFCTVAMTHGLGVNLVERLENLSGYRFHFPAGDVNAARNPVNYSFYRFSMGGRVYPVFSRVSAYGFDYTGRGNKLAHHVVLDDAEFAEAGPTWVARQKGFFTAQWSGEPKLYYQPRVVATPPRPSGVAETWRDITSDAGWAGVVAEHTLLAPDTVVAILYQPDLPSDQVLALLDEAMALIPPQQRWELTFSTYLTDMPTGTTCRWRCMLPASAEWAKIRRNRGVLAIDLTGGQLGKAVGGQLVDAARGGLNPYEDRILAVETVSAQSTNAPGRGDRESAISRGPTPSYRLRGGSALAGAIAELEVVTPPPLRYNNRGGRWRIWVAVAATVIISVAVAIALKLNRNRSAMELSKLVATSTTEPTTSPATWKDDTEKVKSFVSFLAQSKPRFANSKRSVTLGAPDYGARLERMGARIQWVEEPVTGASFDNQNSWSPLVTFRKSHAGQTLHFKAKVTAAGDTSSIDSPMVNVTVEDRAPRPKVDFEPKNPTLRSGDTLILKAALDPSDDDGPDEQPKFTWTFRKPLVRPEEIGSEARIPIDDSLAGKSFEVELTTFDGKSSDTWSKPFKVEPSAPIAPATRPAATTIASQRTDGSPQPSKLERSYKIVFPVGRSFSPSEELRILWQTLGSTIGRLEAANSAQFQHVAAIKQDRHPGFRGLPIRVEPAIRITRLETQAIDDRTIIPFQVSLKIDSLTTRNVMTFFIDISSPDKTSVEVLDTNDDAATVLLNDYTFCLFDTKGQLIGRFQFFGVSTLEEETKDAEADLAAQKQRQEALGGVLAEAKASVVAAEAELAKVGNTVLEERSRLREIKDDQARKDKQAEIDKLLPAASEKRDKKAEAARQADKDLDDAQIRHKQARDRLAALKQAAPALKRRYAAARKAMDSQE